MAGPFRSLRWRQKVAVNCRECNQLVPEFYRRVHLRIDKFNFDNNLVSRSFGEPPAYLMIALVFEPAGFSTQGHPTLLPWRRNTTPMSVKFLLRFDDVCPTMDWKLWQEVEKILVEEDIKPLLAVIPDNQDESLHDGEPDQHFWDRVRAWQTRGWTIGLHGYQHRYVTQDPGILGLRNYSEFAGLPLQEQQAKLTKALEIFHRQGLRPKVWIAPAHSFDANTIQALASLGIRTISDGFALYPHRDSHGILWIPQQLGKLRPVPPGVWTLCIHLQDKEYADLANFRRIIRELRNRTTTFPEVAQAYAHRRKSMLDSAFAALLNSAIRAKHALKRRPAQSRTLPPARESEPDATCKTAAAPNTSHPPAPAPVAKLPEHVLVTAESTTSIHPR
jgi:predicted deacetylase